MDACCLLINAVHFHTLFPMLFLGMNVVMPTAMSILHQDAELKECAAKTAKNGKKILRLLKGHDSVIDNCMAIDRVCAGVRGEDELFQVRNWVCACLYLLMQQSSAELKIFLFALNDSTGRNSFKTISTDRMKKKLSGWLLLSFVERFQTSSRLKTNS